MHKSHQEYRYQEFPSWFQRNATLLPNDYGLCDMNGKLSEWTHDSYKGSLGTGRKKTPYERQIPLKQNSFARSMVGFEPPLGQTSMKWWIVYLCIPNQAPQSFLISISTRRYVSGISAISVFSNGDKG